MLSHLAGPRGQWPSQEGKAGAGPTSDSKEYTFLDALQARSADGSESSLPQAGAGIANLVGGTTLSPSLDEAELARGDHSSVGRDASLRSGWHSLATVNPR